MRKTEKAILIEGLRKLSADAAQIADALEGKTAPAAEEQPVAEPEPVTVEEQPATGPEEEQPATEPAKEITYEDMRAVLAEKSRSGYRAEVKALIAAHGADHLSKITDPAERAQVIKEAEAIGNG